MPRTCPSPAPPPTLSCSRAVSLQQQRSKKWLHSMQPPKQRSNWLCSMPPSSNRIRGNSTSNCNSTRRCRRCNSSGSSTSGSSTSGSSTSGSSSCSSSHLTLLPWMSNPPYPLHMLSPQTHTFNPPCQKMMAARTVAATSDYDNAVLVHPGAQGQWVHVVLVIDVLLFHFLFVNACWHACRDREAALVLAISTLHVTALLANHAAHSALLLCSLSIALSAGSMSFLTFGIIRHMQARAARCHLACVTATAQGATMHCGLPSPSRARLNPFPISITITITSWPLKGGARTEPA